MNGMKDRSVPGFLEFLTSRRPPWDLPADCSSIGQERRRAQDNFQPDPPGSRDSTVVSRKKQRLGYRRWYSRSPFLSDFSVHKVDSHGPGRFSCMQNQAPGIFSNCFTLNHSLYWKMVPFCGTWWSRSVLCAETDGQDALALLLLLLLPCLHEAERRARSLVGGFALLVGVEMGGQQSVPIEGECVQCVVFVLPSRGLKLWWPLVVAQSKSSTCSSRRGSSTS